MRALLLPLVIWAVPAPALAHPLLQVEPGAGDTRRVACEGESTEPACETPEDCEGEPGDRVCRPTVGGTPYCLGPADVTCCFAGREATECPLVDGYDVRCVEIPSSGDVVVVGGTAFCIYDRAGTTACAEAVAADGELALACHTTAEGGLDAPVLAESGDCDRDGVPNVRDLGPCDRAVGAGDAGSTPDAHGVASWDYRGSGGCTCRVAPPERTALPWLAATLVGLALSRRRARR